MLNMSLLLTLTYFAPCSSVYIVNFEHVNADWDGTSVRKVHNPLNTISS